MLAVLTASACAAASCRMFLALFIIGFVTLAAVIFCKNHANHLRFSSGPDAMKCFTNAFGVQSCY
jgi:hypothetical protein